MDQGKSHAFAYNDIIISLLHEKKTYASATPDHLVPGESKLAHEVRPTLTDLFCVTKATDTARTGVHKPINESPERPDDVHPGQLGLGQNAEAGIPETGKGRLEDNQQEDEGGL